MSEDEAQSPKSKRPRLDKDGQITVAQPAGTPMASQTGDPATPSTSKSGTGALQSTACPKGKGKLLSKLNHDEARWVSLGIAMNIVVVPELRSFVERTMMELYQKLLTEQPPINRQTYKHKHEKLGPYTLEYRNINNNVQFKGKGSKEKYDFKVVNYVDLSRLFMEPRMCKMNNFADADASALLTLICNVDDSKCPNPKFVQAVKVAAEGMRRTRNIWAHCSFKEWEANQYVSHFQSLEVLLQHSVSSQVQPSALKELNAYKVTDGDDLIQSLIKTKPDEAERYILLKNYSERLFQVQQKTIQNVRQTEPLSYDISKYVQLRLCVNQNLFDDANIKGQGYNELVEITAIARMTHGDEIKLEHLFGKRGTDEGLGTVKEDPRTVIIVGAPGSGKTFSCYHLLDRIINDGLFKSHAKFPFFIRFRVSNKWEGMISFRDLLLRYSGPPNVEKDESLFWEELMTLEDEITMVLDGFDESEGLGFNYNSAFATDYYSTTGEQKPQLLLYNLICGNFLRKARVLITTRPHCVNSLREWANRAGETRVVSISPMDFERRKEMVIGELKDHSLNENSVLEYIEGNGALCGLCSVPINAKRLLDYIRYTHHGCTSLQEDKLPKTMAGLLMVLVIKILETDRKLQDERDPNAMLAGLHLTQVPVEEVEELDRQNQGQHDSLLSMYLGATGDKMVTKYLPLIYPGTEAQQYEEKCKRDLKTFWQCNNKRWEIEVMPGCAVKLDLFRDKRREKTLHRLYMYQSSQYDMSQELTPPLYDHHKVWKLLEYKKTASDWMVIDYYIQSLPTPVQCLITKSPRELVDNLCSTKFTGLWVNTEDVDNMKALQTLITKHNTLTKLGLVSKCENAWNMWSQGNYTQLHCQVVWLKNSGVDMNVVCTALSKSHRLDTLNVSGHFFESGEVPALNSLRALKHLCLYSSGIKSNFDVRSLCQLISQGNITWLHLYRIRLNEKGTALLAQCLSSEACRLQTLRLQECDLTPLGRETLCESIKDAAHLTALELSYNFEVYSKPRRSGIGNTLVPIISSILSHNSAIRELDISDNKITDITDLGKVLQTNYNILVLDLSRNFLSAASQSELCTTLSENTSIRVLLMNNCDLNSAAVDQLTASLTHNNHLKVLSLADNDLVREASVANLINSTSIEVLDVRECGLFPVDDSPHGLVQALCGKSSSGCSSIQFLGWGTRRSSRVCTSLLTKLCESYHGPLQAIYVPCKTDSVRKAGDALAHRLGKPHPVRYRAISMNMMNGRLYGDLVADIGHRWYSLPPERRWWLLKP